MCRRVAAGSSSSHQLLAATHNQDTSHVTLACSIQSLAEHRGLAFPKLMNALDILVNGCDVVVAYHVVPRLPELGPVSVADCCLRVFTTAVSSAFRMLAFLCE